MIKTSVTLPPVERLWRAARAMRNFTTMDLMMMAGAERQETINFCRALVRGGISESSL